MTSKKKNASLDALEKEASGDIRGKKEDNIEARPIVNEKKKSAPKKTTQQFPFQIPIKAHYKLREYVFHNPETTIGNCLLEALDLWFKNKGMKTIKELEE